MCVCVCVRSHAPVSTQGEREVEERAYWITRHHVSGEQNFYWVFFGVCVGGPIWSTRNRYFNPQSQTGPVTFPTTLPCQVSRVPSAGRKPSSKWEGSAACPSEPVCYPLQSVLLPHHPFLFPPISPSYFRVSFQEENKPLLSLVNMNLAPQPGMNDLINATFILF